MVPAVSNVRIGRPSESQTTCNLVFNPPFVRPIQREEALFSQTCGSSVSFQTGSINHEKGGVLGTFGKSRKNLFEDAHVTPSDKTVIKSFIGAVFFWSILPSETELENMDNSTDNFLIVLSGKAS